MKGRNVQPVFRTHCRPFHLLFFLCFGILLKAQEEQPVFEQYGEEKGYFSSMVNDLLEDRYGFIWIAAVEGLLQFDGYRFQAYPSDAKDSCTLSSRYITQIMEDRLGNIWAVTPSGLNCFDRQRQCFQRFFHVDSDTTSLSANLVFDIHEDEQGNIWVTTSEGVDRFDPASGGFEHWLKQPASIEEGRTIQIHSLEENQLLLVQDYQLMVLDTRSKTRQFFPLPLEPGKQTADHIRSVRRQDDFFFICTRTGLWTWSPADGAFTKIQLPPPFAEAYLIDAVAYYGHWWLASRGLGLLQFDPKTGDLIVHEARPENKAGIMDMHVRRLLVDRNQNLWIGSFAGLNRLNRYTDIFSVYHPMPGFDNISNFILRIRQDNQGGIWLYNRWQGLTYASSLGEKAAVLDYPKNEYWIEKDTKEVYCDRDDVVWLARGYDGLHRYNLRTKTWLPTVRTPELESVQYHFIIEDVRDSTWLWLSTSDGLCRLNRYTLATEWYRPRDQLPELGSNLIVNMAQFDGEKLWLTGIGYANGQIGYLDLTDYRFHFFPYDPGNVEAAPGGSMKRTVFTPDGMLWIASLHGLIRCDPKTNTFKLFTQQDGLADPQLTNLESDQRGHLWMTQDNNIYRYRPEDNRFDRFHPQAPVRFISRCSDYGLDDRIFFGTNNGVLAFFPDKADNRPPPPKVLLTDVQIVNQSPTLDVPVQELQRLVLKHNQNILSLEFVSLQFQDPELFSYAYRLDGFEKEWTQAGNERRATYTNLDPGKYTFRVKAANSDGVWNEEETTLEIKIRPPWWATVWAYLLYAGLVFLIARMVYQTLLRRRLEKQESQNLRELDEFKTNFFTNITHEFRTPLTLIQGPTQRLLQEARESGDQHSAEQLDRIYRNSDYLLQMINQLLDLQKLEAGKMEPELHPVDLIRFSKYLTLSFQSLAEKRAIDLRFRANVEQYPTRFDKEKLQHILYNLLSNALKFTEAGGEVTLEVELADELIFAVRDTGLGIPQAMQATVFERFQQLGTAPNQAIGSGIGLSLTRELVYLLKGSISLESEVGQGTTFRLAFPRPERLSGDVPAGPFYGGGEVPSAGVAEDHAPLVLIVEDHPEVAQFIAECLAPVYRLDFAPNGKAGIEKALELVPDLIVSDVMMPEADGLTLCGTLKADQRTSHVPIILLTAKAAVAQRLEGLKTGADEYLAKPFDEEELLVRIQNLLTIRQKLKEKFAQLVAQPMPATEPPPEDVEMRFVLEAKARVLEHLSDPEFTVEPFCRAIGMSRTQLHRKLTSLTGLSATRFINDIRLVEAEKLLRHTDQTIAEVAFDCGFNDPNYFTRLFVKKFEKSPSEYRKF